MRPDDCQIHQEEITEMGDYNDTATGLFLVGVMGLIAWAAMYSFFFA